MRSDDLTAEEVERYADGELTGSEAGQAVEHVRSCPRCAAAVLEVLQMKRAVRDAIPRTKAPDSARLRVLHAMSADEVKEQKTSRAGWWFALAAAVALAFVLAGVWRARGTAAAHELADMHATLLSSANPVDVLSTDRHSVKPWFEGRVPFAVPVPDLAGTPFHLIGGRVVFWRNTTGAYLLVGKGSHRISVFVFPEGTAPMPAAIPPVSILSWRGAGLSFAAVADIPRDDLIALRRAFGS